MIFIYGGNLTEWLVFFGDNPYLRSVLTQVAWAISHTKNHPLSAQYHRLARRIGRKQAIVAVSHSVLVIIYHILRTKKPYVVNCFIR